MQTSHFLSEEQIFPEFTPTIRESWYAYASVLGTWYIKLILDNGTSHKSETCLQHNHLKPCLLSRIYKCQNRSHSC